MIKKALLCLCILCISFTVCLAQEKYTISSEKIDLEYDYKINDFYLIHHLFADAFFMTNLYKQFDYDEMTEIISSIKENLIKNEKTFLTVPQKSGADGRLVFLVMELSEKGKAVVMMTNFNNEKRVFEKEIDGENSIFRWYFMRNDRMVYRKDEYSKSLEKEKKNGKAYELIDFYLFDDNQKNDSKVKPLIDDLLANNKSKIEQLYGRLYLSEYWIREGNLKKATKAIKDLADYFENETEIPRYYQMIIDMATTELEISKRFK